MSNMENNQSKTQGRLKSEKNEETLDNDGKKSVKEYTKSSQINSIFRSGLDPKYFKNLLKSSIFLVILVAITSAVSLFYPDIYNDPLNIKSQALGQDLITLALVVPLHVYAIWKVKTELGTNVQSLLILGGCYLYEWYSYVLYLILSNFNSFFLLYEAIASISFYSLVSLLFKMDYSPENPIRGYLEVRVKTGGYVKFMAVIVVLFYFVWGSSILPGIMSGQVPEAIEVDKQHGVYIMDMVFLLPFVGISAWKLKRNETMGYLFTGIVLFKLTTLSIAIVSMVIFMAAYDQPIDMGLTVIFSVISVISVYLTVKFYWGKK